MADGEVRPAAGAAPVEADEWARYVRRVATVHSDRMGREVIVVPDLLARYMRAEIKRGWREFPGVADGESRAFVPGTRMFALTAVLLAVYANSPVPRDLAGEDAHSARRDRERAAAYGQMHVSIVGRCAWDNDTRWWRDYDQTRDWHVPAYPTLSFRDGLAYRFCG